VRINNAKSPHRDGINALNLKAHPHQHAKSVKQETRQMYSIERVCAAVLKALPEQGINHEITTEECMKARGSVQNKYTGVVICLGSGE